MWLQESAVFLEDEFLQLACHKGVISDPRFMVCGPWGCEAEGGFWLLPKNMSWSGCLPGQAAFIALSWRLPAAFAMEVVGERLLLSI